MNRNYDLNNGEPFNSLTTNEQYYFLERYYPIGTLFRHKETNSLVEIIDYDLKVSRLNNNIFNIQVKVLSGTFKYHTNISPNDIATIHPTFFKPDKTYWRTKLINELFI